ncbi:hypothetical protein AWJ20_1509 [Sugiyamaella lignohabitans]|uniref:RING-type domain-containing protein n=1 Tax=Sugiyamaella lignohabitans TaxID=796027 RepID=A0A161HK24_9ASCO|nr:uncharacterized protein AWJ20_1509 [Sugiyamaella lignohabitans]ANB13227.1 hypothetical protein AWJ20_1509 [Sugiyamaella lignohabitans]
MKTCSTNSGSSMNDLLDQESPTTPRFKTSFHPYDEQPKSDPPNFNALFGTSHLIRSSTSSTSSSGGRRTSDGSNASLTTFSRASNFLKFGKSKHNSASSTSTSSSTGNRRIGVKPNSEAKRLSTSSLSSLTALTPIPRSITSFPKVAPLKIAKQKPSIKVNDEPSSIKEKENSGHPDTPPKVIPFIYKATNTPYLANTLVDDRCCFCEDPLQLMLEDEDFVTLLCSHVAHFHCLKYLIDMEFVTPEDLEKGMPACPTCDEIAMPTEKEVYHELIKQRLLEPKFHTYKVDYDEPYRNHTLETIPASPTESDSFDGLIGSPPPLTPSGQSSNVTEGSPDSYLSSPGRPEIGSYEFHTEEDENNYELGSREDRSLSRPDPVKPQFSEPSRPSIAQIPAGNRNTVVLKPLPPGISIDTELEKVAISDSEQYVSCLLTVNVPEDFYTSQLRYKRTPEDLDNGRKVTKRLAKPYMDRNKSDIYRYGALRMYDEFYLSRDLNSWQLMTCYMYPKILVLARDFRDEDDPDVYGQKLRVKGEVLLSEYLRSVSVLTENGTMLHLSMDSQDFPDLYLSSRNPAIIDAWRAALLDPTLQFHIHKDIKSHNEFRRSSLVNTRTFSPVSPISVRPPVDAVLVLPVTGFAVEDLKFPTLRLCVTTLLENMGQFDRLSVILYNSRVGIFRKTDFINQHWSGWKETLRNITPSASDGNKNDLFGALYVCRQLLSTREEPRPVSSVYIVNDSSYFTTEKMPNYEETISYFQTNSVSIHTFGVTINHISDGLAGVSSVTGGTYLYTRDWSELPQSLLSRFKTDQTFTHRRVRINFKPSNRTSITSISGVETAIKAEVLQSIDGSLARNVTKKSFESVDFQTVTLGGLYAGQTRSFLVQISIPPEEIVPKSEDWEQQREMMMELFTAKLSYSGFGEDNGQAEDIDLGVRATANILVYSENGNHGLPSGNEVAEFNQRFSTCSSIYSPTYPRTDMDRDSLYLNNLPPSPLYGDLLITFDLLRAPLFLSCDRHSMRVARRRIQLVAARTLENALLQCATGSPRDAHKSLDECRPILRGIFEVAMTDPQTTQLALETKALLKVLDKDIGVISEKILRPIAFASDVRNWVIQTIGVLRSQKAFTLRSPIEEMFYFPQDTPITKDVSEGYSLQVV